MVIAMSRIIICHLFALGSPSVIAHAFIYPQMLNFSKMADIEMKEDF